MRAWSALLFAACSSTAPPQPTLDHRTHPDEPVSICGAFERTLEARLHKAVAALHGEPTKYGGGPWTEEGLRAAIPDSGLSCLPFARGAWIIEPGDDLDLSWSLEITTTVQFRAVVDGREVKGISPGARVGYGGMPTTMRVQIASDYDDDGVPELWARTDEDGVEGGHFASSWLLSAHGGRISEYAPAQALGVMGVPVDVDGDGRLDLPVDRDLAVIESRSCEGRPEMRPADLLAHALPDGTFSTTDAIATERLRRWCPAIPAQIVTTEGALCARVRANPAQLVALKATVASSCVPWDCALGAQGKPQLPGASRDCNALIDTLGQ
jgi:hypothetical protein